MMWDFYLIILFVAIGIICLFVSPRCGSRWNKIMAVLSGAFILIGLISTLWTDQYLLGVGCTGHVLKGISCPDDGFITSLAILHNLSLYLAIAYACFVLPVVVFFGVFIELTYGGKGE